jgi:Zn-dependent protease with chaperone function
VPVPDRLASHLPWISLFVLVSLFPATAQTSAANPDEPVNVDSPATSSPDNLAAVEPAPPASPGKPDAGASEVPATSQAPAARKSRLPAKFDVNRIGQRGVGHGIDIYTMPKERALGQSVATRIDDSTKLVTDPDVNDYINRLAQKVGRNSDTEFLITAKIIDTDDWNIFSLPGGFIYVDKGLITRLDGEAELASLIAHEIAHIAARHATHALTRQYGWEAMSLPLLFLGPVAFPLETIGIPLTNRKLDRDAEREADLLGMQYAYASGYDPVAFVAALEKLNGLEARRAQAYSHIPLYKQFMKMPFRGPLSHAASKHPSMESRIRALQKEIATLLPEESVYVVDTNEFQEVQDRLNWANRPMFRRHTNSDSGDKDKKDRPKLRDMIPLPVPSGTPGRSQAWHARAH